MSLVIQKINACVPFLFIDLISPELYIKSSPMPEGQQAMGQGSARHQHDMNEVKAERVEERDGTGT